MAVCERHGLFYNDSQICGQCWREDQSVKVKERKAERTFSKVKYSKPMTQKGIDRLKLKSKLQSAWSAYMKKVYKEMGIEYCFITGKTSTQKGLFSLHVSHYYPKGQVWQLWCDPCNSGLSVYDQNINKPENATAMRSKLVEIWGKEKMEELDAKEKYFRERIQQGLDTKHPTDIWIIGMVNLLKQK